MPLDDQMVKDAETWKQDRAERKLSASLGQATQVNDPVTARRAEVVSQETEIPFSTAEANIDEAEATSRAMRRNTDMMKLRNETPATAAWMSDPKRARMTIDDMEVMQSFELAQRRQGSYWKNLGLGVGERVNSLTGNLIQFAGMSVSGYEQLIEARFNLDEDTLNLSDKIDYLGKAISEGGLGYEAMYSWEDFKEAPTAKNLAAYAMETGGMSIVDIGAMMASLPVYLMSRTQEIAESRAQNSGRDKVDPMDVIKAMPTAVAVSLIDRYSAKGALGMLNDKVATVTMKHGAIELAKATGREAATEFVQEQVEYVGETIGTGAAMSIKESLDRGFAGAVAGGPMGGVMRAATLPLDAVNKTIERNFERDLKTVNEQQSLDNMISSSQSMKLNQEAPEVAREFFKGMDPDDRIYISPQAIEEALEAGLSVPQYIQDQMGGGLDISLTMDQFVLDVATDEALTESMRPHMKRSADALTQYEIQNRDSTQLERLMNLAKEDQAVRTEADDIHEEVVAQLVASGRLTRATADISAQIIPAYVTTKVSELQDRGIEVTPRDIYDEMNFRIAPAPNAKEAPKAPKVYEAPPEVENAPEITSATDTTVEVVAAETTAESDIAVEPVSETDTETDTKPAKKPKKAKKPTVQIQHENPRIDMYFKEVTKRIPQLTEAAKQVEDGTMTPEEYSRLVNQHKPVTPYDMVPTPATVEEIDTALSKDKVAKIGAPTKTLEDGHAVGVRLDIPAYTRHGTWVVSVHEKGAGFKAGKSVGYESVALVTDATLGSHEGTSMKIAAGKAKSTIAVVKGKWKNVTPEEAIEMANNALSDPAYVQVGYDPERHSYFYDRATMKPIVGAAEVLQVGPLTLAKAPVYGDSSDFLYQEETQAPRKSLSTRTPSAADITEDHRTDTLVVGLEAMTGEGMELSEKGAKQVEEAFAKNVATMTEYENYRPSKNVTSDIDKAERLIEHMVDNLMWLHDKFNADERGRATMWYEGAREIADRLADRYDMTPEAVAGVMATLSPQKDWYMNVSLAERVIDTMSTQKDTAWDKKMDKTAKRIFGSKKYAGPLAAVKGKKLKQLKARPWPHDEKKVGKKMVKLSRAEKKELSQQTLAAEKAMWIRIYDETHNFRGHRIIAPEGNFQQLARSVNTGDFKKTGWGSLTEIAKAVRAVDNPVEENISDQLGEMHKVRNFYNNIINPLGDLTSVTIDTHAVAAALLQPLSGESTEVTHNFGGKGSSSTSFSGAKGTYGIYAEAYRRAAEKAGLQPRQMQSITWEAVRGLFTAQYKGERKIGTGEFKMKQGKLKEIKVSENLLEIKAIWQRYADGKITQAKAQERIHAHAKGISNPTWVGSAVSNDGSIPDSSYQGVVSGDGISGGSADTVDGGIGAEPSPDSTVLNQSEAEKASTDLRNAALAELEMLLPGMSEDVEFEFEENVTDELILEYVHKNSSYKGEDIGESADWIRGVQKFGEAGMTFEARMARAKEMGFDVETIYYHGSSSTTIRGFVLDREGVGRDFVFVTPDADFAATFAGYNEGFVQPKGISVGPVYPVLIKPVQVLDHQNMSEEEEADIHQHIQISLDEVGTPGDQLIAGADWRMRAIASGNWEIIERDRHIQQALQWMKYTGFTVLEGGDPSRGNNDPDNVKNTALFRPEHIRSVHAVFDPARADETTILAQDAETKKGKERGSIELRPDGERIIRLSQSADLSTFLHESGHLFLETEKLLAAKYGLGDNQKAMLKMLGVESFEDIETKHHELWARTFEDYLRTGKAPSRGLREAFMSFSRWLSKIYQSMRQLGLPVNKEVTDIFDRMLATEAEIAGVAAGAEYEQFFKNKEQLGGTQKQWDNYQKSLKNRKKKAESTLFEKLLAELGNRRTKEWNEEKDPLVEQEKEKLAGTPVYQALSVAKDIPLDREAVAAALGVDKIPQKSKLQFLTKKGGEDPEVLAEELGYASVGEMVVDMHNAEALNKAADAAAEAMMIDKYGDIMNDGTIEAEAREAMHNEVQAEMMLAELKAIKYQSRKQSLPDVDREFLKAKAAETVAGMTYSELKPERFHRAEVTAAKKVGAAKTLEEAYEAKLQQLANHYLFLAATKAKKDAIRYRDHIKAVQKRDYKTSQVDGEYIQSMKRLAKMYDTANKPKEAKRLKAARKFADWVAGQQRDGVDVNLKDLNIIELRAGVEFLPSFDEMTLENLQSVYEQLKHLRFVGGKIAGEVKSELTAERDLMAAQLDELGVSVKKSDWESARRKRLRGWTQHMIHMVPSLRNMIRDLGDGAFFDSIYRRISQAENKKLNTTEDFYNKLDSLFGDFDIRKLADSKTSGRKITKEDGSTWELSARQRFMLAAYWGTESSREAIRQGYNVVDADVMKMMEHMSDEELDMVQALWEHSDHMKTPLFEAAHEREGVAPPELVHTPFMVNGKTMRGGHMRLFYGGSAGEIESKIRLDEDPLDSINSVVPSKAGSTYERRGSGGRIPLLEVQNIYRNIEENAHFIAYATTATELQHIFNNKDLRRSLVEKHGDGFDKALLQSIQGLTTNYKEHDAIGGLAAIIRQMRYAKSMMYLAYNVKNILQQFASVIPSMAEMGPINYITASMAFHGNFAENRAFVDEKSAQMRARKAHLNREAADMMKRVESGSKAEAAINKFAQHGFTPHVVLDMAISYPTWLATYNTEMEKHGDEELAIINADVTVAETIGSGMDLHLGKVFRSNEAAYMKMLTVFGSWFNSSIFQRAYRNTKGGKKWMSGPAFEALVMTPMLTMMMSEVIAMNIPKWDDDEDETDFLLDIAKWAGLGYTGFMGATIPIFGDLLPAQTNFKPSTLLDDAIATIQETPGFAAKVISGESSVIEGFENFIKVAGSFIAVPGSGNVVRLLDYTQSALEGNEEMPETIPEVIGTMLQPFVEGKQKN